jgi:hypothetical protein
MRRRSAVLALRSTGRLLAVVGECSAVASGGQDRPPSIIARARVPSSPLTPQVGIHAWDATKAYPTSQG